MGSISLSIPQTGQPNSTQDPLVASDFTTLQTLLNGNLDASNLSPGAGYLQLASRAAGGSLAAASGDVIAAAAGVTITLPAPVNNATVGVFANSGVSGASPVTVSGTAINGVGLAVNASSFQLGVPFAHAILQSDGTHWFVVSGQQDTGRVALSLNAGWTTTAGAYTPSARLVGDRVWLRGAVTYVSGANPIATLPAGMRPAATVVLQAGTVTTGGVFTGAATTALQLDGLSFSLT